MDGTSYKRPISEIRLEMGKVEKKYFVIKLSTNTSWSHSDQTNRPLLKPILHEKSINNLRTNMVTTRPVKYLL